MNAGCVRYGDVQTVCGALDLCEFPLASSTIPTRMLWHCCGIAGSTNRRPKFGCADCFSRRPRAYGTPIHDIECAMKDRFEEVHRLFAPSPNAGIGDGGIATYAASDGRHNCY
jgi:hypothetical protein